MVFSYGLHCILHFTMDDIIETKNITIYIARVSFNTVQAFLECIH